VGGHPYWGIVQHWRQACQAHRRRGRHAAGWHGLV